jgi:hypothetical protein
MNDQIDLFLFKIINNLPFKHSTIFGNSPRNESILSVVSPGVGFGNTLVSKLYFCRNSFIRSPLFP